MQLDDTICYCFHISKRKIFNFLRVRQPKRASQISECGGAGTGCGWCIPFLKRYFAETAAQKSTVTREPLAADDLTPQEYARQRARYIREGRGQPAAGAIPLPPEDSDGGPTPGDE